MSKFKNEVIVGAIVVFALVLGFVGYVYIQEIPVTQKGYFISIQFENVAGLTDSDPITVSGMKIGRVRSMELKEGHVSVRVWLSDKIPLPRDSRAVIKSQGMIGEKYIALAAGSSKEILKDGDIIIGIYDNDIADVGASISELVNQATSLLNKFNDTLDEKTLAGAKEDAIVSMRNLRAISSKLELYAKNNSTALENTIKNLDTLSTRLSSFWQVNNVSMNNTVKNIASASATLPNIVTKLDSVLFVTQALLSKVEKSEGTVGKLVANDEIYNKANQTLNDVQALLAEIKKRPDKYFNASLIDLF